MRFEFAIVCAGLLLLPSPVAVTSENPQTASPQFNLAGFSRPDWMRALYEGDVAALRRARELAILGYLAGMRNLLADNPARYGPECESRIDRGVSAALDRKIAAQAQQIIAAVPSGRGGLDNIAIMTRLDGRTDVQILVNRFGGCRSESFERVYETFQAYVLDREPNQASTKIAATSPQRIVASCVRWGENMMKEGVPRFRTREDMTGFCECVAPKIANSALTPVDRNAFMGDYLDAIAALTPENQRTVMNPILIACNK